MNRAGFVTLIVACAAWAAMPDVDARRGSNFFRTQMCLDCHGVRGQGKGIAPDLGRRLDRNYTPAGIVARMWSHAPTMWEAMNKQNIPLPNVSQEQAADLFAYFYAVRFFEKPGEAERGKHLFESKRCSECHSITESGKGIGPPVEKWESLAAPILLIQHMWNHQTEMRGAMAERNIPWPQLSSAELNDMLVYLQNLPQTRNLEHFLLMTPSSEGEPVFRAKGCTGCHVGAMALENKLGDVTLTDVAAAMWNHAPQMRQPPPQFTITEMRQVISYVWARQFFATRGDAARGHKTFESKKCATCHNDPSSGAPPIAKSAEPYSAITMVSVLWRHGPAMLRKMQEKHISWPQLSQAEMANLIAYLNSR